MIKHKNKNNMNTTRNYLLALAALAVASCGDEQIPGTGNEGHEATITLSISAAPEVAGMTGTRAITETIEEGTGSTYKIADFWLLQYNENGNQIGRIQHFVMDGVSSSMAIAVILPPVGRIYTCVVIANTHSDNLIATLGNVATLEEVKNAYKNIRRLEDLYDCGDDHDLVMNGAVELITTTTALDCQLYRNVAKLTLEITNAANSGLKINSVQLCNVPDRLYHADQLRASNPPVTVTQPGVFNFPLDACVVNAGDNMKSISYFLPRNCKGTNTASTEAGKNRNIPAGATYVEIQANLDDGTPMLYRFYPGANMINDFNIEPNHHYVLPLTFNGPGDPVTDDRVENMGLVELAEANSYIINPLPATQSIYCVPVHDRINAFWKNEAKTVEEEITSSTDWVAEVIWQDKATPLITFRTLSGTTGDTYAGHGKYPFYFSPVAPGVSGNVLVGVRKQGANVYLWSWHLWITEYNPDVIKGTPWQENVYSYPVTGGAVHRYAGGPWATTQQGKYIMDRNLGAASATRGDGIPQTRGMFYQFGRKDPFPSPNASLYNIDGSADVIAISTGPATFSAAVNYPANFHTRSNGDWASPNPYFTITWNNPTWYTSSTGKSLFDPCPLGWKLPVAWTWSVFAGPNVSGTFQGSSNNAGWEFYMGGVATGGTAFYPASGYRHGMTGTLSNMQIYGCYWSASPASSSNGYNFIFHANSVSPLYDDNRSFGLSVRCIQE
jgi:uncharacterized protein (TIGR02145 family)